MISTPSGHTIRVMRVIHFYLIVFLFFFTSAAYAKQVSVNGENVNLRSGPGTSYQVKWEYGKGFPLQIVERKGEWVRVSDFEKDTGWIHGSLLSDTRFVIINVHKNSKKQVNIRSGPSTGENIVGKAYYGVVFERIDQKNGWSKVRHENGLVGWIKDTLLWGD